eukprot:RCo048852
MVKKGKGAGSGSENVRVCVRCRDLSEFEKSLGCKSAVVLDLTNMSVVVHHAAGDPAGPWTFDAVYNNRFTQKDIYVQEVHPLVESVLQGYNATVFAYGQSGSGKTYTMTGITSDKELAGIMPNAIDHIFQSVAKMSSPSKQYKVKVSHLELYNNKPSDLLAEKPDTLEIKQNMAKNFYVKGLVESPVSNREETLKVFDHSLERRRTRCTDLNEHSSRSHAVFTVSVESIDFEADPTAPLHMVSKLNLVDLAGSERQSKTGAVGDALKEGCNINLSLSALGTVIDSIVTGKEHIPYRSNPLTMLLKDSLGGNSKTVMVANIGPADRNVAETISTLRFADRAKQIQNKPVKNLDPKDLKIQQLLEEIERLQKRLGGTATDSEENAALVEQVEHLQFELSSANASREKERLALEEELRVKDRTITELTSALAAKEAEVQALQNEKTMWGQNLRDGAEEANELRQTLVRFIRSAVSESELKRIESRRQPAAASGEGGEKGWDLPTIFAMLEGVKEVYTEIKANAITPADVEAAMTTQVREFEAKLATFAKTQEQARAGLENERAMLLAQQEASREEL